MFLQLSSSSLCLPCYLVSQHWYHERMDYYLWASCHNNKWNCPTQVWLYEWTCLGLWFNAMSCKFCQTCQEIVLSGFLLLEARIVAEHESFSVQVNIWHISKTSSNLASAGNQMTAWMTLWTCLVCTCCSCIVWKGGWWRPRQQCALSSWGSDLTNQTKL